MFSLSVPSSCTPSKSGSTDMSANHQIAFFHHRVFENQSIVQSVCPRCGEFVGASKDPGNLKIAEAAHECPCVSDGSDALAVEAVRLSGDN
jgi:hypothetical protein